MCNFTIKIKIKKKKYKNNFFKLEFDIIKPTQPELDIDQARTRGSIREHPQAPQRSNQDNF